MENKDLHREHKGGPGNSNRITSIIIEHWEKVRGDKHIPSEQDLDPNVLEELLNNCFLLKATELAGAGKHNYVYIGKNILDAYGSNITAPKDYHDIDPLSHKDKFEEVLRTRKPVMDEGEFVNQNGHIVKYRQCLVPLGKDGRTIESIFGGMRFKVFS
jgi:hypothetical protein